MNLLLACRDLPLPQFAEIVRSIGITEARINYRHRGAWTMPAVNDGPRANRNLSCGNAEAELVPFNNPLSKQAEVNRPANSFVTVHGGD
jgi:hypothetical protein